MQGSFVRRSSLHLLRPRPLLKRKIQRDPCDYKGHTHKQRSVQLSMSARSPSRSTVQKSSGLAFCKQIVVFGSFLMIFCIAHLPLRHPCLLGVNIQYPSATFIIKGDRPGCVFANWFQRTGKQQILQL